MSTDLFTPTETHEALRDMIARFSKDNIAPQADEFDRTEGFNDELFRRFAKELGLFGVTVAEDAGGLGLDAIAAVIIHEEMSRYDPGLTLSYLAHEVLFVNNFYNSSNQDQRDRYLQKVIDGTWIAGMAMSEPNAGTDVLGMQTFARKNGDHYVLNGTKQWITNGPNGDIFLVYARTDKNDPRVLSAFLVERTFEGFDVGRKETKMGMRASPTSQLMFDDVKVPVENMLGKEGSALTHMMRNLEIERITLAAMSIGIARECTDILVNYAINERKAFGKPLSSFGQIQRFIAESYAQTQAARTLVYHAASLISPNKRSSLSAASAKLVATTTAELVARNAIQTLGGYGYVREYNVERLLRDAILLSIGGGTNEAMQKNITADLVRLSR